jgi:hypothetical protein
MDKPKSRAELIPYLEMNPDVRVTDSDGFDYRKWYMSNDKDGLRFAQSDAPDCVLPIHLRRTDMTFDEEGFTFAGYGKSMRVVYREDGAP